MKVNVNVLIGCVLCILMMALVGVMHRASEDQDGWRPSDVYSHVGTVSHSDVSVASSGSSKLMNDLSCSCIMRAAKATASSWVDTKAQSGTTYRYTVRAVDGSFSAYEAGLVIKK